MTMSVVRIVDNSIVSVLLATYSVLVVFKLSVLTLVNNYGYVERCTRRRWAIYNHFSRWFQSRMPTLFCGES